MSMTFKPASSKGMANSAARPWGKARKATSEEEAICWMSGSEKKRPLLAKRGKTSPTGAMAYFREVMTVIW